MSNWVTRPPQNIWASTAISGLGDQEVLNKSASGSVATKTPGSEVLIAEWENASMPPFVIDDSGSKTRVFERSPGIDEHLRGIFRLARWESFEDGVESNFSLALVSFIEEHGRVAMEAVDFFIRAGSESDEAVAEALRWLGHMGDQHITYAYRFHVLLKNLAHRSPLVRDGALLGLSFLDDQRAIPAIEEAMRNEECTALREDMGQVIQQL